MLSSSGFQQCFKECIQQLHAGLASPLLLWVSESYVSSRSLIGDNIQACGLVYSACLQVCFAIMHGFVIQSLISCWVDVNVFYYFTIGFTAAECQGRHIYSPGGWSCCAQAIARSFLNRSCNGASGGRYGLVSFSISTHKAEHLWRDSSPACIMLMSTSRCGSATRLPDSQCHNGLTCH